MERQPNERLADLINEAGVSHLGLARRIADVAAEWGETTRPAHTQVSRWLAGQCPRDSTASLIAEALSRKLGRRVTITDIGMADTADSPDLGLTVADTADNLIDVVADLWRADIKRRKLLLGSVSISTITNPAFDWLLGTTPRTYAGSGTRRVGMSDVNAVRETAAMFTGLDNRFGGAHARTAAVQYLSDQVTPLLNGSFAHTVGSELFSAVAEFNLTVAWMAYDTGMHGLARRYFLQALALARHADDRLLGASVLSAISHQANYLGDHRDALNLARAASHGIRHHNRPLLQAQFAAMQARAAAKMPGERAECESALGEADTAWNKHRVGDGPEWISYFDESELADEFAHCFRDLDDPSRSFQYASQCLDSASPEYARSRIFSRIVLATSALDLGDIDQACAIVADTLPNISETASMRCITYLQDFHGKLTPHRHHPAVVELVEKSRPLLQSDHLPQAPWVRGR